MLQTLLAGRESSKSPTHHPFRRECCDSTENPPVTKQPAQLLLAMWNTLEAAKLAAAFLTPLSVALIGLLISRHLKRLDLLQWKNQKLLEKRIAIYDEIAPKLNLLLCFYTWVGYWKSTSPEEIIRAKRDLDKTVNVYRHVFPDKVYLAYQSFMHLLFETYSGPGQDAKLLTEIESADGDRRLDASFVWQPEWDELFLQEVRTASKRSVRDAYQTLMSELTKSFGVPADPLRQAV